MIRDQVTYWHVVSLMDDAKLSYLHEILFYLSIRKLHIHATGLRIGGSTMILCFQDF